MYNKQEMIEKIKKDWDENPRWNGIKRPYTPEEVVKLKGTQIIFLFLSRNFLK